MNAQRLHVIVFIAITAWSFVSQAGFVEIGASASYRRSTVDVDAYDESKSVTGSIAYYFTEASAVELSYTDGSDVRVIAPDAQNWHTTSLAYKSVGLDLIYTMGPHDATFRPYVKAGANYVLQKQIVDQYEQDGQLYDASTPSPYDHYIAPSAGVGFRIGLTEALSLKAGIDAWASGPATQTPMTFDYMARAGLAWLF
jgi:outer membrane protein W